jgi:hypothetical protein
MSSSATRRMKRFQEQQTKKFFDKQPKLKIPTEEELAEYIMNKSNELRVSTPINNNKTELTLNIKSNGENINI